MSNVISWRCFIAASIFLVVSGITFAEEQDVRVVSNRIQAAAHIEWTETGIPGPVVLSIPGFGEIFVAYCAANGNPPKIGFRNTSSQALDVVTTAGFAPPPFNTTEQGVLEAATEAILFGEPSVLTIQIGVGREKNRRVATVVAGGLLDGVGICRFQAQAVIHRF